MGYSEVYDIIKRETFQKFNKDGSQKTTTTRRLTKFIDKNRQTINRLVSNKRKNEIYGLKSELVKIRTKKTRERILWIE